MTMQLIERAAATATAAGPGVDRRPRRPWRVLVAVALAVPLVAFTAVYLLFFTPDSPPSLRLSSQGPAAAGSAVAVPTGAWSVGRGSVVGYRVREKLLRLPAPNDAVGRTSAVTGGFRIESTRSDGGNGEGIGEGIVLRQGLNMTADVSSLISDEPRRDDHMRTMAIQTDRFPTATFVSTADVVVPASVVAGGRSAFNVAGDLTVHGVTRPVSIPVEAQRAGDRIEVVGSFTFGWDLFEMVRPNLSYVTVEADPTLEFQLFFDAESGRSLLGVGSEDQGS